MKLRMLVVAWKELLQLRRDRLTLAMMAVLPVMQLLLFGYAINTDVRHIPTLVDDHDRSAESRDLARRMEATGFYDLVGEVHGYDDIEHALRSGEARAALVVPARFGADVQAGRTAQVQLVVDGSDPQIVGSAENTAASLVGVRAEQIRIEELSRVGERLAPVPIELAPDILYNQDQRTAVYIVPGLIAILLTMTMVMLTSMALARERERGTLEQLIVSPVKPVELIVGKILPYVAIGYVQMTLILAFGRYIFDVPIRGSLGLLYALAFLFIAANLAIGLFFSTLAKTQQQAMQMSFFFFLPNILLSGFMFPFEAMPRPAQWLSQALPITHFLRIVRGIVLKGSSFDDLHVELVWLTGILAALVAFSSLRFRKKLV
ncbi:MAG TPA: ABC transporter permease [Polyangiaceae bacterium]|nr:ABC transporter permease [Polyangiaceae bacterium]